MTPKETILGAKFADFGSELRQLSELIAIGMVFCYQNCSDLLREKKCSSDRETLLKFEAEDQEFAKFVKSLEQFIRTVKDQTNF